MKKAFSVISIFILFWVSTTNAYANDQSSAVVKELLLVSGAYEQYKQMTIIMNENMKAGFLQGINNSISNRNIPEEKLKKINNLSSKYIDDFQAKTDEYIEKAMPWEQLVEKVYAPIYLEHFSEAEIRKVIEFYASDIGKKMVSATPIIMQKASTKIQQNYSHKINQFAIDVMQSSLSELQSKIEEICAGEC